MERFLIKAGFCYYMTIKNIIFDWSGTLSDDLTPVYKASMLVFKKLGKESISLARYKKEFTLPYMIFWNKYFPDITKEEQDNLFSKAIHQVEEPTLYPEAKNTLKKIDSMNIRMIVISSHPHDKLRKEAKSYGVQHLFQEINGGIHDKTETILSIIQRNKFNPQETMYVGDMTHDIDAGKKAKVVTVALGWGYQTKEKLMESGPDYYISNILELVKLLK